MLDAVDGLHHQDAGHQPSAQHRCQRAQHLYPVVPACTAAAQRAQQGAYQRKLAPHAATVAVPGSARTQRRQAVKANSLQEVSSLRLAAEATHCSSDVCQQVICSLMCLLVQQSSPICVRAAALPGSHHACKDCHCKAAHVGQKVRCIRQDGQAAATPGKLVSHCPGFPALFETTRDGAAHDCNCWAAAAAHLFAMMPPATSTTINRTARTSAAMSFRWTCASGSFSRRPSQHKTWAHRKQCERACDASRDFSGEKSSASMHDGERLSAPAHLRLFEHTPYKKQAAGRRQRSQVTRCQT